MAAASVAALTVVCALLFLIPSGVGGSDAAPQDDYPDADVIICEGEKGYVSLIYRMESSDSAPSYYTRTVRSGGDVRLFSSSEARPAINVVMLGGSIGTLTILMLDRYDRNTVSSDVTFDMVGGSINTLQAVSVSAGFASSLPTSYYRAFNIIGLLDITVGGTVREFNPTNAMVGISSMDLKIVDGAMIHRLYPTGSDGSYEHVKVVMTGGSVGYLSNQSSYIGKLEYDLRNGSIDYLCIGADTEGGTGYNLSNFWTSYVRYDADVYIGAFMEVGSAILGAGITDVPAVLCNGQTPETVIARNVNIDCSAVSLVMDRCFIASEGKAYRFSSYLIGGDPSIMTQRTTYYTAYQSNPVYGDGGIWTSATGTDVFEGVQLTINSDARVNAGSIMSVAPGAIVVNADSIILYGTIDNEGIFRNNSVIEKRSGGSFNGDIEGEGVLAYGITVLPSKEGRVDVMAESDDAVVLRAEGGDLYFNTASVYLKSSNSRIVITAPSSMYIGGDSFTVGLDMVDRTADSQTWSIFLSGIAVDTSITIDVTVPLRLADGFTANVSAPDGSSADVVSIQSGTLTFRATGSGNYTIVAVAEEDSKEPFISGMTLNIIVAVLITIVAAAVVYLLLRDA